MAALGNKFIDIITVPISTLPWQKVDYTTNASAGDIIEIKFEGKCS